MILTNRSKRKIDILQFLNNKKKRNIRRKQEKIRKLI